LSTVLQHAAWITYTTLTVISTVIRPFRLYRTECDVVKTVTSHSRHVKVTFKSMSVLIQATTRVRTIDFLPLSLN